MTKQEYNSRLNELETKLDNGVTDGVYEELERLEQYKPVRLQLYYLKLKCRLMQPEKYPDILGDSVGKYFNGYMYPYLNKTLETVWEVHKFRNRNLLCRQLRYIKRTLNSRGGHYTTLIELCNEYMTNKTEVAERRFYYEMYAASEFLGVMIHYAYNQTVLNNPYELYSFDERFNGSNMGYFKEQLSKDTSFPYVLFAEQHNKELVKILASDLFKLGKRVVCINDSLIYEDDNIDIKNTIAISVQYTTEVDGVIYFTPVDIVRSDGNCDSNIMYLFEYINSKYGDGKCLNILASDCLIDALSQMKKTGTFFTRLSDYRYEVLEHTMGYAIYGDYLAYVSNIYCKDCRKLLEDKSSVKFSIVIPARDSSEVLESALKTCLEQRFNGRYEIIISDNSTGDNEEIYNLCQKINDDRIVYVRTPRDLPLARSFEYACLHTKGEYVVTIGSDDGLLPWALEILEAVTNTYPDEEIIQWERGFYAWPGFSKFQENQFIIPEKYEKGKLHLFYRETGTYLKMVMDNPQKMYLLPMLYINSCFKRSYMQTLIRKTGCLWDGICQDIYMGVVTAIINDKILNMRYPLSIAGMSRGSIGANANKGMNSNEKFRSMLANRSKENAMGGNCRLVWERYIPMTGTDSSSLYTSLLRAVDIGILPRDYLDNYFDWQKLFIQLYQELDIRDVAYDMKVHSMRYYAMKHGEEFLKWFDETIYNVAFETILSSDDMKKVTFNKFKEEKMENGGIILDASKYDVHNVYEATKLFERISEL